MEKLLLKILWIALGVVCVLIVLALAIGSGLSGGGLTIGSITKAGDPIVAAIESYRVDHRGLPGGLEDLVPGYLAPLQEVTYYRRRYARQPDKLLFGRPRSTHWIYKTTSDTEHFALGIDASNHTAHYDSRTGRWHFYENQAFRTFGTR